MFLQRSLGGFLVGTNRSVTDSLEVASLNSDHLGTSYSRSVNRDDFRSLKQVTLGSLYSLMTRQVRPGLSFKFLKQTSSGRPFLTRAKVDSICWFRAFEDG